MASNDCLITIPARMGSSRFPGKPLARLADKSLIERVWRIASLIKTADILLVTDSNEIKNFAEGFGASVQMTAADCQTGLDRSADAVKRVNSQHDIIVTLQGDAVLTPPWVIQDLIDLMRKDSAINISTPIVKLEGKQLQQFIELKKSGSSTGTTVTFDRDYNALYFSKTIIPHSRDVSKAQEVYRHIGLYAYRRDILLRLASLAQTKFELIEQLEQLRALENGIPIRVLQVDYRGRTHVSIDNPEDIQRAEAAIAEEGELF